MAHLESGRYKEKEEESVEMSRKNEVDIVDNVLNGYLIGHVVATAEQELVKHILKGTGVTDTRYITIDTIDSAISSGSKSRVSKRIFKNQQQIDTANINWERLNLDSTVYYAIGHFRGPSTPVFSTLTPQEVLERIKNIDYIDEQDRNILLQLLRIVDVIH